MMGNIEVDSRDTQLKKVLQDIGCNKGNPINYKCDSKKSIGENMFYQDQEREILFQKSAELQKSGKSTR